MSEEKKYRIWSSTDIEKYHKGLLSPKEMNELERAALDDPFLADALEGYANVNVNMPADIDELEKKLEQRVNEGKVVRMAPPFNIYRSLKIAAVIVLIAGGGLLIYQFGFNNNNKPLAVEQNKEVKQPEAPKASDIVGTDSQQQQTLKTGSTALKWEADGDGVKLDTVRLITTAGAGSFATSLPKDSISTAYNYTMNAQLSHLPSEKANAKTEGLLSKSNAEVSPVYKAPMNQQDKNFGEVIVRADSMSPSYRKEAGSVGVISNVFYSKAKAPAISNNYFNGRIVDNNNNAVPFANVTNIRDNVGTYADANGIFTLISPDTALNLRIKSVGFESDTVRFIGNTTNQFIGYTASNQVTLKEDKMNSVVLGKKRLGKIPKPEDNIKIEEPEPADGWSNYSLYLANNLKVPDEMKRKDAPGEVQLSFEVNKFGEPVNIKVEKSLCKECDEEAIRVIKQGPKWKTKKKKSRVTVKVPFETSE